MPDSAGDGLEPASRAGVHPPAGAVRPRFHAQRRAGRGGGARGGRPVRDVECAIPGRALESEKIFPGAATGSGDAGGRPAWGKLHPLDADGGVRHPGRFHRTLCCLRRGGAAAFTGRILAGQEIFEPGGLKNFIVKTYAK